MLSLWSDTLTLLVSSKIQKYNVKFNSIVPYIFIYKSFFFFKYLFFVRRHADPFKKIFVIYYDVYSY